MNEVSMVAEPRQSAGSAACRRLRAQGRVPAVLYGHGTDPRPLEVDARELRHALSGESGLNALLSLQVGGTRQLALARQIQRDPLKGAVTHVDFLAVNRDEIVSAEVPIRLVGEADAVHRANGAVDQQLFALAVQAKPAEIPAHIDVDISGIQLGDAIRVGDLVLPPGVTATTDPDEPVVMATIGKEAVVAEGDGEAGASPAEPAGASEA